MKAFITGFGIGTFIVGLMDLVHPIHLVAGVVIIGIGAFMKKS